MRIRIVCECSKRFSVDEKHRGKLVQCPGCMKKHRVEASAPVAVASAPAGPVPDDKDDVVVSPLTTYAPFIIFGSIGAFLLLCVVIVVGIVIGIRSAGSAPGEPLAELPKNKGAEKKTPAPGKKDAPAKTGAETFEAKKDPAQHIEGDKPKKDPGAEKDPRESTEKKDPAKQPVALEGTGLRFVLEEDKGNQSRSTGPIEVAVADKAPVPYKVRRLKPSDSAERKRLRLGLTPPMYDNMAKLLDKLGDGYRYSGVTEAQLGSLKTLRTFDVLFLTCKPTIRMPLVELKEDEEPKEMNDDPAKNPVIQQALKQMELEAKKQGVPFDPKKVMGLFKLVGKDKKGIFAMNAPQSAAAIRRFVEEGGTLYASDLRYDHVLSAFPEMGADPGGAAVGFPKLLNVPVGHFDAEVVDSGLRRFLGQDRIELHLESAGWKPAVFDETKVTIMARGKLKQGNKAPGLGGPAGKLPAKGKFPAADVVYPLLAKFQFKKGTVIFTSFHNATQNSDIEKKLLEYLVFSLVNAGSESKLKQLMLAADFTVEDLQLLSFSKDKGALTKTHAHAGGSLQIAVGFENVGAAKFRLHLKSPQGSPIVHEEPGLYLIEVPAAAAGNWEYTVTPVSLPYDNFPVMLGIGKGK